ncbi:hypothetical protein BJX63DRAFT_284911 [Aspergillus granulosus]|uniref:Secreted protein n=1 Tax=Aspergillus granulosus TaxID=176169 RepID=A0ABR4HZ62_9EURO
MGRRGERVCALGSVVWLIALFVQPSTSPEPREECLGAGILPWAKTRALRVLWPRGRGILSHRRLAQWSAAVGLQAHTWLPRDLEARSGHQWYEGGKVLRQNGVGRETKNRGRGRRYRKGCNGGIDPKAGLGGRSGRKFGGLDSEGNSLN